MCVPSHRALRAAPGGRDHCPSAGFIEKETDAPRGGPTCPRPPSQEGGAGVHLGEPGPWSLHGAVGMCRLLGTFDRVPLLPPPTSSSPPQLFTSGHPVTGVGIHPPGHQLPRAGTRPAQGTCDRRQLHVGTGGGQPTPGLPGLHSPNSQSSFDWQVPHGSAGQRPDPQGPKGEHHSHTFLSPGPHTKSVRSPRTCPSPGSRLPPPPSNSSQLCAHCGGQGMNAPSTKGEGGDPRKKQKKTEQSREGEERRGSSWKDRERREEEERPGGAEGLRSWAPERIYYLQDLNCWEQTAAGNPLGASSMPQRKPSLCGTRGTKAPPKCLLRCRISVTQGPHIQTPKL